MQQLVTRSAGAVRAVWGAISKFFQLKYAVKRIIYLKTEVQKNKRTKGLSAIEICASLVKLRDRELSGYMAKGKTSSRLGTYPLNSTWEATIPVLLSHSRKVA